MSDDTKMSGYEIDHLGIQQSEGPRDILNKCESGLLDPADTPFDLKNLKGEIPSSPPISTAYSSIGIYESNSIVQESLRDTKKEIEESCSSSLSNSGSIFKARPLRDMPSSSDKPQQECRGISSSVTILRPKSPTKSSVDENSLLAFVEESFKDSFIDNVCPWEDIIRAFSAPFLFRSQTGASIPNVDMQMYWCNFCQFKSQEKREMIKHSMTHRFKCNYCDKESFCRNDIIKHSFLMHPEYKKIRKDLKACVLLGDFLDRDEMVMMSGSQNLDKELLNINDSGRNSFDSHHSSLDPACLTTRMPIVVHDDRTSDASMLLSSFNSSITNLTRGQPGDLNSCSETNFEIIHISPPGTPQLSLISDDKCTSDSTDGHRTLPPELNVCAAVNIEENATAVTSADSVNSETSPMDTTCDTIAIASNVNILQITTPTIKLSPPHISDTEMKLSEEMEPAKETEPSEETDPSEKTEPSEKMKMSEESELCEKLELSEKMGLTESPQSVDPVFSPLITSVETLRNDDSQIISNLPPIDVITTVVPLAGTDLPVAPVNKDEDITNPSMPVLKRTKGGNGSDSDSTLDDDDVDPDYIPEAKHHKNGRVTRSTTRHTPQKKKSETQNPKVATKFKTKTNSQDEGKPTTHFWRCGYCRCRSASMEKISAHQKEKHKGKPIKCLSVLATKDGEIVQDQSKADQVTKLKSPIKSPVPSSATPESATKSISEHNKNKASESISDPKDAGDKKDLRYSCMFCDHKSNDMQSMRQHMFKLHPSEKFCCVDTLLKGQGKDYYSFFCCRHKCNFLTLKPKEYLEHVERCTPVPKVEKEGKDHKPTGLQQTCLFVEELLGEKSPSSNKKDNMEKESKEMKVKTSDTKPDEKRLYSCHRCVFSGSGDEAMKAHMLAKHPDVTMIALVRKSDSSLDFYLFCPEVGCPYTTQRKPELEKHRQEKHQVDPSKAAVEDIEDDKKDIKLIPEMKSEDVTEKRTMTYMPAYMCLYCETSCITTSLANMKRHVQESHPNETIIVRDCVAYKRKCPSRIYVCDNTGCLFNDLDYKEYLIHICAHKNSCLYECSSCSSWVSLDKKDFIEHIKKDTTSKHTLVRLNVSMTADGSVKRISAQESS